MFSTSICKRNPWYSNLWGVSSLLPLLWLATFWDWTCDSWQMSVSMPFMCWCFSCPSLQSISLHSSLNSYWTSIPRCAHHARTRQGSVGYAQCILGQVVLLYFSTLGIWKFGGNALLRSIQRSSKSTDMGNCPPFISLTSALSLVNLVLVSSSLEEVMTSFPFLLEIDNPYCSSWSNIEQCSGCMCVVV